MEVKLDLHIHSEHSPDGRMALDVGAQRHRVSLKLHTKRPPVSDRRPFAAQIYLPTQKRAKMRFVMSSRMEAPVS